MPRTSVIAIDGPSASGKSVVGLLLAQRLDYAFVDTGSMYRAVTLLALEQGIAPADPAALSAIAETMDYRLEAGKDGLPRVFVNGRDVTRELPSPEVDHAVSQVSQAPGVRNALVRLQRKMAEKGSIVMVGRDIGTVVLPSAGLKVYLEASAEVRARRRYDEMQHRGEAANYDGVLEDMRRRDKLDSERALSPLRAAPDARRVETSKLTIDEVVECLWRLTEKP